MLMKIIKANVIAFFTLLENNGSLDSSSCPKTALLGPLSLNQKQSVKVRLTC